MKVGDHCLKNQTSSKSAKQLKQNNAKAESLNYPVNLAAASQGILVKYIFLMSLEEPISGLSYYHS